MATFLGIFLLLLVTGLPIALALGVGGMLYLYLAGHGALLLAFPQRMLAGVDIFVLLTIPLFLLAGGLMNVGGITDRIIDFARSMVGHRRGGLSSVAVLSSMFFAGISGSATAEASAIGTLLIPAMTRQGIPAPYAASLIGVSAIVGPIIPPSIPIIVFGVLSGVSIGQLFIAGIVPGLLLTVGFLIYATWYAKRNSFALIAKASWAERWRATKRTLPALMLPVIIIVGIKAGVFTATESAAVAVVYALLVGFLYRDLTVPRVWEAMAATAILTSGLLFIVAMASIVGFVFTLERIPDQVAGFVLSLTDNPVLILLMLNVCLLILGMFLEPITIMILTMPILLKIMALVGMDPVQFGMMVVLNVVIGLATPPVGICLFIVCAIARCSIVDVSRAALPLIGIALIVLALIALVPPITLFLPNVFGTVQ